MFARVRITSIDTVAWADELARPRTNRRPFCVFEEAITGDLSHLNLIAFRFARSQLTISLTVREREHGPRSCSISQDKPRKVAPDWCRSDMMMLHLSEGNGVPWQARVSVALFPSTPFVWRSDQGIIGAAITLTTLFSKKE